MTLFLDPSIGIYKTAFDPLSLFVAIQGDWFLASDFSTMWQDAAGTIPVAMVGDAVARWDSKSGSGRYVSNNGTSDNYPLLQQDINGNYYVVFDGIDDELFTLSGMRNYTTGAGNFVGACASFPAVPIGTSIFATRENPSGGSVDYHQLQYNSTNPKGRAEVRGGPNTAAPATVNAANNSMPVDTPAVVTSVLATNGLTIDVSVNNSRPVTAVTTFGAVPFATGCGFTMATSRMQNTGTISNVRIYGAIAAASITDQNRANASRYLGSLAGLKI